MRKFALLIYVCIVWVPVLAQDEKLDQAMVEKIRNEGLNNSRVMDIAFYLTDVNGPRLQGSPGYMKAANWAKNKLSEWGFQNAKLEPWGNWGKGWELERSYIAITAPYYRPVIGYPKSWTSGSGGLKQADVIIVDAKDSAELMNFKGKLRGKVILLPRTDTLKPTYTPDGSRWSDEDLQKMAAYDPA